MWVDNASKIDMLFYKPYSDVIIKMLKNSGLTPITIGLFGKWGAGKSTLMNFIDEEVEKLADDGLCCININAWLLEGYDDAKAAIIEALLNALEENKTFFKKCSDKIKKLLKKINWLKLGGYLAKKRNSNSSINRNYEPIAFSFFFRWGL